MGHRRWTRRRQALAIAGALVLIVAVATFHLFVLPDTDAPRKVDAVVVLGGDGDRLGKGRRLVKAGYAKTLLVSVPGGCTGATPGVRTICFRPQPFTTRGEARSVAAFAKANGWKSLIVVSSTDQTTRARLRFGRCTRASHLDRLQIFYVPAATPTFQWPYRVAYEWAALAKALFLQRSC